MWLALYWVKSEAQQPASPGGLCFSAQSTCFLQWATNRPGSLLSTSYAHVTPTFIEPCSRAQQLPWVILAQTPSDSMMILLPWSVPKAPSTIKLLQPHLGPHYLILWYFFSPKSPFSHAIVQRHLSQNLRLALYKLKMGKIWERVLEEQRWGWVEACNFVSRGCYTWHVQKSLNSWNARQSVCAYVSICVQVCMRVCICICELSVWYVSMYIVHMVYVLLCVHAYICVNVHRVYVFMCMYAYVCMNANTVCVCMCLCLWYPCFAVWVCIHVCSVYFGERRLQFLWTCH